MFEKSFYFVKKDRFSAVFQEINYSLQGTPPEPERIGRSGVVGAIHESPA
jgi:hypothetical protein